MRNCGMLLFAYMQSQGINLGKLNDNFNTCRG
jgi:hypothetical protein